MFLNDFLRKNDVTLSIPNKDIDTLFTISNIFYTLFEHLLLLPIALYKL